MLPYDPHLVLLKARAASTEDLLNRVTVYREGMEPGAVAILETELRDRGVTAEEIHAHAVRAHGRVLVDADGIAEKCSFCRRPAVSAEWRMHRLWGKIPVFPRHFRYCEEHRPA